MMTQIRLNSKLSSKMIKKFGKENYILKIKKGKLKMIRQVKKQTQLQNSLARIMIRKLKMLAISFENFL